MGEAGKPDQELLAPPKSHHTPESHLLSGLSLAALPPSARYPQPAAHSQMLSAAPAGKDRPAKLNQQHSLADVLSGEDDPARLALEAADVPLLLQCQEGLALLDLLLAACAVWSRGAKRRGNG